MAKLSKLESMYKKINNTDIKVYNFHTSETKKATCVHTDKMKAISIDKPRIINSAEERTILAEELSHYETGSLYLIEATSNTAIGRINRISCEAKAKHNTIKMLLPFEELKEAVQSGYAEIYELAEYFEVTEDLIKDAITYYTCNCGLSFNL